MATRFRWLSLAALMTVGLATAIVIYSCSSKSSPTNPGGGGGGGGGVELNSGNIADNTTFSHTFANPGSFPYHCNFHSGMTGTITVNSGGSTMDTTLDMITGAAYLPVTCKVGGTIHWHNHNGVGTIHTVTSD